jgi:hypothetical protein
LTVTTLNRESGYISLGCCSERRKLQRYSLARAGAPHPLRKLPLHRMSRQRATKTTQASNIPQQIFGSPRLQGKLRTLCTEYSDIFSRDIEGTEPAKNIPFMKLKIDKDRWYGAKRQGPRALSTLKENDLGRQMEKMIDGCFIQPSQATQYSQPLLTPKPNGTFRFCVDFRWLNNCCESIYKHPLPRIWIS